jgi:putative DNA primase/helicase
VATQAPQPPAPHSSKPGAAGQGWFDLEAFAAKHLTVQRIDPYRGGRRFILDHCPFDPNHTGTSAAIIELSNGALQFVCQHDSCSGCKWADLRELFEPGYQDRRGLTSGHKGTQTAAAVAGAPNDEQAITIKMSDVEPEEVEWLWRDRIALGKLNLLVGDPGNGKSFATLDIAAHVSTGTDFPDGSPCQQGSVILITGEDGIADTVRPRLDAQGADVTRIHHLKIKAGDTERQFDIGTHIDQLREKIREHGDVRLLIIDPLTAYLGDTDPNKDSRVRALLTPFAALAEEMRVAILAVMHLNKAAVMDAIYRVTGSVAFIAQARAAWAVVPDPQELSRRLFLKLKANLAPADIPGLAFTIAANEQGRPVLTWCDEVVTLSLRDVMGGFSNARRGPKPNKLELAKSLITDLLSDGKEHPSVDFDTAAKAAEISMRTLNEAAKVLGVERRKDGFAGGWLWSLDVGENSASSPNSYRNSASSREIAENNGFLAHGNSASPARNPEGAEFPGNDESLHLRDKAANGIGPKRVNGASSNDREKF